VYLPTQRNDKKNVEINFLNTLFRNIISLNIIPLNISFHQ